MAKKLSKNKKIRPYKIRMVNNRKIMLNQIINKRESMIKK